MIYLNLSIAGLRCLFEKDFIANTVPSFEHLITST